MFNKSNSQRKFQKAWTLLTWVIAAGLSLTACAPARPAKSNLPPLRVEFAEWWGDYTIIIAENQGLFEKHGVAVEILYYVDYSSKALPDFAANKLDAGLFGITDVLNIANATDLDVVAVYDDGGASAVVARPEVTSVADLKGKRIGVSIGTTYEMFVVEMLATAGLTSADVTLLDLEAGDGPAALANKEVDAVFIWGSFAGEALAAGNHVVFSSKQLSNLYPDLITFRASVVEERPEDVRAFLNAWFEAVDFRQQHPEEARQIIEDYFKSTVVKVAPDDGLHLMTLADNQALYKHEKTGNLTPIYDAATTNAEFLLRIGVLDKMPKMEQLFNPSFLPK